MSRILRSGVWVILSFLPIVGIGQNPLAPIPPMGWNSWDSYGLTIDEMQFKANVDVMAKRLKAAGYQYAVVDEGWYLENPQKKKDQNFIYRIDANGRYEPALGRFVSAKGMRGFKPVSDYVHAQGLKFGIHIIRGIPKEAVAKNLPIADSSLHATDAADTTDLCPWNPDNFGVKNNPAGQAWYDSLIQQYAAWGVDYIKVDCIASHPYKGDEIRMIHRAIVKTHRPILLSLSPGPAPLEKAAELAANAQLWRISDDVWDRWERPVNEHFPQGVKNQFDLIASWAQHLKPGNWPDADMLPLGTLGPTPGWGQPRKTRLTSEEQTTLMTLWAISRSPLFIGANLTELDDNTLALLTNKDLVAIHRYGRDQKLFRDEDSLVIWTSEIGTKQRYIALFNLGDSPMLLDRPYNTLGVPQQQFHVREVWTGKTIDSSLGPIAWRVVLTIPPHGCALLALNR